MEKMEPFSNTTSPGIPTRSTEPTETIHSDHVCKVVLYYEIPDTRVRIWDVIILVPNFLFLLFLILKFNKALLKFRATSSPIYKTFYCLVFINAVVSIIRCFVSMGVNLSSLVGGYTDLILWVIVRFFILMTEISVVVFALAFGHLDSHSSVRYVLIVTSLISLAYSVCQGSLEVLIHDENFHFDTIRNEKVMLFGHGGVWFFCISSFIFALLYLTILVLPWTRVRDRLALPVKKSFYVYITLLVLLNVCYIVSGGLLAFGVKEGLCIMDVITYVYFTFFTPLVYYTFLSDFFEVSQSNILFSYKGQTDESGSSGGDDVSLPHQQSLSSIKTDSEYIYQTNSIYESTQFDATSPVNPLYVASLQSPDSITGYSLDSQIIDIPTSSKP